MQAFIQDVIQSNNPLQTVLDYAYKDWRGDDSLVAYSDMIDHVEKKYGALAKLVVLAGKYNYQVNNGGHSQYFDNGYATRGNVGAFNSKDSIDLHEEMVSLMREFGFQDQPVFAIMQGFTMELKDCFDCDGSGTVWGEAEESDDGWDSYEEECFTCNGTGTGHEYAGVGNDDAYYAVNDAWLKTLRDTVRKYFLVKNS